MTRDINNILKKGANLKIKVIDYGTTEQKIKLLELRKRSDLILSNKNVNWDRLSKMYITR